MVKRLFDKKNRKTDMDIFFFIQAILGFVLCIMMVLGLLPQNLLSMAKSAVDATGSILCAIFLTAFFIPFLTEYGLVDFVGVLCRPLMRKLFHTPGSSAVIGVSAFLDNYSMGYVISRQMYEEGRFTEMGKYENTGTSAGWGDQQGRVILHDHDNKKPYVWQKRGKQ